MSPSSAQGLEQLVQQLIDRQAESRSLDYKGPMAFGPTAADKGDILKCLMAFSNTRDGGKMLVGVKEAGGKFIPTGLSQDQAASFDPTKLGDFAQNYCSVLPRVTVQVVPVDGLDVLLLQIDEFDEEPIVCTKDLHDKSGKKLVLRAGSIYVRTPDARCVAIESGEAMRNFLDLAVQKRGDTLLQQIRRLVGGPEGSSVSEPSAAYGQELDSAADLFNREEIADPYWYVELMPAAYDNDRIATNSRLQEIRREAAVSIRGWDFPHVDREREHAFEYGVESITHWSRHHEAHRLYRSGLFTWRRLLAEDYAEEYVRTISYVSAIYSLTEFLIFANRYSSLVADEGDFVLRIGVTGLAGRVLRSTQDILSQDFQTGAQRFDRVYQLPVEELRASHLELAAEAARRLFELYNVDITTDVIRDWQTKFIARQF